MKNGNGIMKYNDGSIYKGTFSNDHKSGQGKLEAVYFNFLF